MKALMINSFKKEKKKIIAYIFLVIFIITFKTIGKNIPEFSIFAGEAFSILFVFCILISYALGLIATDRLMIDKKMSYLLTLKASRKDLVNEKFLSVLTNLIINFVTIVYVLQGTKIDDYTFKTMAFIILMFMIMYMMILPIYIKFEKSRVYSIFFLFPIIIPLLDKLGINPLKFTKRIVESSNNFWLISFPIIFILIIYIASIILVEKKDF